MKYLPQNKPNLSWRRAAPFMAGTALVGAVVFAFTFAAGPLAAFEPELGTLAGGASSVTTSGASGGKVVQFNAPATPTPTPTATATPGARSCPAFPAFPDANCTGVPAGYALTTVNGDLTTAAAGQVIDGKYITGSLIIKHDNVTITNTRVIKNVIMNDHTGIVMQDFDLGADTCPGAKNGETRAITAPGGYGWTVIRGHIHNTANDALVVGGGDGVLGTSVLQDSLLDRTCFYANDHLDAIQWYDPGGFGRVSIIHSNIDVRPINNSDKGNAAIFWADGAASGTTLTAYNNRFAGGNYTTSLYDALKNSGNILDVHDNVYVKNSYNAAACSFGGSVKSIVFDGTSGVKFTNNKYDDGTAVSCN